MALSTVSAMRSPTRGSAARRPARVRLLPTGTRRDRPAVGRSTRAGAPAATRRAARAAPPLSARLFAEFAADEPLEKLVVGRGLRGEEPLGELAGHGRRHALLTPSTSIDTRATFRALR